MVALREHQLIEIHMIDNKIYKYATIIMGFCKKFTSLFLGASIFGQSDDIEQ